VSEVGQSAASCPIYKNGKLFLDAGNESVTPPSETVALSSLAISLMLPG